jgi:hypothetical protein
MPCAILSLLIIPKTVCPFPTPCKLLSHVKLFKNVLTLNNWKRSPFPMTCVGVIIHHGIIKICHDIMHEIL